MRPRDVGPGGAASEEPRASGEGRLPEGPGLRGARVRAGLPPVRPGVKGAETRDGAGAGPGADRRGALSRGRCPSRDFDGCGGRGVDDPRVEWTGAPGAAAGPLTSELRRPPTSCSRGARPSGRRTPRPVRPCRRRRTALISPLAELRRERAGGTPGGGARDLPAPTCALEFRPLSVPVRGPVDQC